jgi:hypothetical protein
VRPRAVHLAGYVRGENGDPIPGATVSLADASARTNGSGYFTLTLPGDRLRESSTLRVSAPGYVAWHSAVTPGGNEVVVLLQREKRAK